MVFVQILFDNVDIGSIERRWILKLYEVTRQLDENKEQKPWNNFQSFFFYLKHRKKWIGK